MAGNNGNGSYRGPEKRHAQRRQKADRRIEVRWEPGKTEHRGGLGRRQEDLTWQHSKRV